MPFLCCVLSSVDVGPVDVTCDGQVLLSCDLLTGLVTDGVFFVSFLENLFVPWLRVVWRDHKDRGGPEAGNLQQQFKNSENFAFIFQIRKQQETRKN